MPAVAHIVLSNPKKANSLTPELLSKLTRDLEKAGRDPTTRAVVVTGGGPKVFCGGADLETLGKLTPRSAREFIGLIHNACAAARDCPVPVIARINGWCLGAGLEFAAACDLRIASSNAMFGMPEVRLAIPSVVEAALLPRLMGAGRARWLVLTGEAIDAKTALNWGLVEKVVPPKKLDAAVNAVLDLILKNDSTAMRTQKRLCKLWEEAPLATSIAASIEDLARAYESNEPRRRIKALRKN
jgi:enoyl-CoA hydratase